MRRMRSVWVLGVLLGLLMLPMAALADSISPTTYSTTLAVGGSVTFTKTVTVSAGTPTEGQGDVFFLCDTTGSMGGTINSVRTNAAAIVSGLSAYGNISTGAASYRDFYQSGTSWGSPGDYAYRLDAAVDGTASTQAGIDTWVAGGGNDGPESQLQALKSLATDPLAGWRAGSEKFVVWFGDAPGHEPSNTPGYPGPSTAETITALQDQGITVLAFNMAGLDSYGQATAITSATGGSLTNGLGSDVVATIVAEIGEAFDKYSTVGIDTSEVSSGLDIDIVPLSYVGDFDRSEERLFEFAVTITGLAAGTYDFSMYGTVDGGRVATELDRIIVTGGGHPVPEPGTMLLLGAGLSAMGLLRYRRKES